MTSLEKNSDHVPLQGPSRRCDSTLHMTCPLCLTLKLIPIARLIYTEVVLLTGCSIFRKLEIWRDFLKIQGLKNHWTNTWFVCTHLSAFCTLNRNMTVKISISIFFGKSLKNLIYCLHNSTPRAPRAERVNIWEVGEDCCMTTASWRREHVWEPTKNMLQFNGRKRQECFTLHNPLRHIPMIHPLKSLIPFEKDVHFFALNYVLIWSLNFPTFYT